MKYHILLSIAITCFLGKSLGAADLPTANSEDVGISPAKLKRVGEAMQERVQENQIPGGVVAIARQGKLVFLESYGWQDKDARVPMAADSIFRLYSMSKAITTAAALMLVDEGKMALDDAVSKYLSEVADWKVKTSDGLIEPRRPMTIKDLMLHTSWMDEHFAYRGNEFWKAEDSDDIVKFFTTLPLTSHPGVKWEYSRSIDLLGFVIEDVSGKPLADFLKERLFDPLGMVDTAFHVPAEKLDRFAMIYGRHGNLTDGFTLYGPTEEQMEMVVTQYYSEPKVAMGGVGILGTAEDYLRFLLMIASGGEWDGKRYLSRESIHLMTTNQLPDHIPNIVSPPGVSRQGIGFGLGFNVVISENTFEENAPVEEFGWAGAAGTHYWVRPQDGLVVVTMEQVIPPINRETRLALRPIIYEAVVPFPAQDEGRSPRADAK
jgi:CubicO group peptidase (beta-lactamase class C family)